jgi:hypothetical protein
VTSEQNKVKSDPLATVKQWKDLLVKTLVRKDNLGESDTWLREQVKDPTWDKCVTHFKDRVKYNPNHQWFRQADPTTNETPPRYLQYGVSVQLTHNKDDRLLTTYGSPKKNPIMWICCVSKYCMRVYDVTGSQKINTDIKKTSMNERSDTHYE